MFNEKDKNLNRIETLLGEHCAITGTITGSGFLKIDGTIDGDVLWEDDIQTSETSMCKGDISCVNAIVSGKIHGNITCQGSLIIENGGSIDGDISVKNLRINEGGIFHGKCTM